MGDDDIAAATAIARCTPQAARGNGARRRSPSFGCSKWIEKRREARDAQRRTAMLREYGREGGGGGAQDTGNAPTASAGSRGAGLEGQDEKQRSVGAHSSSSANATRARRLSFGTSQWAQRGVVRAARADARAAAAAEPEQQQQQQQQQQQHRPPATSTGSRRFGALDWQKRMAARDAAQRYGTPPAAARLSAQRAAAAQQKAEDPNYDPAADTPPVGSVSRHVPLQAAGHWTVDLRGKQQQQQRPLHYGSTELRPEWCASTQTPNVGDMRASFFPPTPGVGCTPGGGPPNTPGRSAARQRTPPRTGAGGGVLATAERSRSRSRSAGRISAAPDAPAAGATATQQQKHRDRELGFRLSFRPQAYFGPQRLLSEAEAAAAAAATEVRGSRTSNPRARSRSPGGVGGGDGDDAHHAAYVNTPRRAHAGATQLRTVDVWRREEVRAGKAQQQHPDTTASPALSGDSGSVGGDGSPTRTHSTPRRSPMVFSTAPERRGGLIPAVPPPVWPPAQQQQQLHYPCGGGGERDSGPGCEADGNSRNNVNNNSAHAPTPARAVSPGDDRADGVCVVAWAAALGAPAPVQDTRARAQAQAHASGVPMGTDSPPSSSPSFGVGDDDDGDGDQDIDGDTRGDAASVSELGASGRREGDAAGVGAGDEVPAAATAATERSCGEPVALTVPAPAPDTLLDEIAALREQNARLLAELARARAQAPPPHDTPHREAPDATSPATPPTSTFVITTTDSLQTAQHVLQLQEGWCGGRQSSTDRPPVVPAGQRRRSAGTASEGSLPLPLPLPRQNTSDFGHGPEGGAAQRTATTSPTAPGSCGGLEGARRSESVLSGSTQSAGSSSGRQRVPQNVFGSCDAGPASFRRAAPQVRHVSFDRVSSGDGDGALSPPMSPSNYFAGGAKRHSVMAMQEEGYRLLASTPGSLGRASSASTEDEPPGTA